MTELPDALADRHGRTLTRRTLGLGAASVALAQALPRGAEAAASPDLAAVANGFGQRLFARELGDRGRNVVLSPLSIGLCAALAAAGASGVSASEFEAAFGLKAGESARLPDLARELADRLKTTDGLSLANGIAMAAGEEALKPAFLQLAKASFDADVLTSANAASVNGWVNGKTQGKIPVLIDALDHLALLNALYFKAAWENAADTARTAPGPFTTSSRGPIQVPMMQKSGFGLTERPGLQAFSLPYEKRQAAMLIVLPAPDRSAVDLAATLTPEQVGGLVDLPSVFGRDVLHLPRFSARSDFELTAGFKALGLASIFDDVRADFGRMLATSAPVEAVAHKAVVEVDEAGTVAAAATGILVGRGIDTKDRRDFRVDRPFLFYLMHVATGAILMQGLINDPSLTST